MWEVATVIALSLICLSAVAMTALRLPGTWVIVVAALGYGWWANWERVGLWIILTLTGLALVAEVIEWLTTGIAARRAGATRQALWGGIIGGLLGTFFLSFVVPIPFVGAVVGALLGCLAGRQ